MLGALAWGAGGLAAGVLTGAGAFAGALPPALLLTALPVLPALRALPEFTTGAAGAGAANTGGSFAMGANRLGGSVSRYLANSCLKLPLGMLAVDRVETPMPV